MKVTKLTETLWLLEEVFPDSLINECQQQILDNFNYVSATNYSARRILDVPKDSVFERINNYIKENIPKIIKITQKPISNFNTDIWADYPGYFITRHLDNSDMYQTMQIYLNGNNSNLGTEFSDTIDGPCQHVIPFKANVGYLMLNSPNGYHGMVHRVPDNFVRLSSYTRFLR
jgi:hypothetical protein